MNFDKENFKKPSLDHLQFRIGELARMTNISTRQLRYWEKQGYVQAIDREDEQESRLYGFRAFIKVAIIKQNLDDGDSLHDAVDKANEQLESAMIIHHIMKKAFQGIEEYEGRVVVNLGYFDDAETQLLYVYLESGKVKYRVVDKREFPITKKSQLL
ncbi:MerR family transcriptional regulator [Leuconostoc falkenbergense]|uniref:MerR family transcriptional regulator n=1 Tax=Leuconostoc falkenbergense TaxID=2766470 RepID=UPI0016676D41|nr:MerR family transcriptional regulator [Leuconostoc falkenbergense]MCT4404861.1 MerR family transcriptional regulator [Leuconostoc falkenbergense]